MATLGNAAAAARLATKFLSEDGLVVLTGAAAAEQGTRAEEAAVAPRQPAGFQPLLVPLSPFVKRFTLSRHVGHISWLGW